jgi:hypothetical protein
MQGGAVSPPLVILWLVPLGLAVLGVLVLTLRAAAREPALRGPVAFALAASAAVLGLALSADPHRLSPRYVTLLHEGTGSSNLMRVAGDALHAGPVYHALAEATGVYRFGDVRPLVLVSLTSLALQAVVAGVVAWRVFGRLAPTLGWVLVLLLNPTAVHGALSETPGPLIGLLCWLAVVPLAALDPRQAPWRATNVLAVGTLTALVVTAAAVRIEFVVVGLPAIFAAVTRLRVGDEPLDAWTRDAAAQARGWLQVAAARPSFPIVVVVACVALHLLRSIGGYELGTAVWMANPFAPEVFGPLVHARSYLPLGVIVLAVAGAIHLLRSPWRSGLVTLGLMSLLRGYRSGSNGVHFEMFRYMGMATPLMLLVGLFGWAELRRVIDRSPAPAAARGLMLTFLALTFVYQPPTGQQELLVPDGRDTPVRDAFPLLLSGVPQEEARMAIAAHERWPTCAIVSKVTAENHGVSRGAAWWWIVVGLGRPRLLQQPGLDLQTVSTRELADVPCVLFLAGQDCNLVAAKDHCERERAAGPALLEKTVIAGQTTEPAEFGYVLGESRLAVHAVRGI